MVRNTSTPTSRKWAAALAADDSVRHLPGDPAHGHHPQGRHHLQTFRQVLLDSLVLILVTLVVALACLYSNYNGILRAGNVSSKYIVYS
jgi:hypothetical protein